MTGLLLVSLILTIVLIPLLPMERKPKKEHDCSGIACTKCYAW